MTPHSVSFLYRDYARVSLGARADLLGTTWVEATTGGEIHWAWNLSDYSDFLWFQLLILVRHHRYRGEEHTAGRSVERSSYFSALCRSLEISESRSHVLVTIKTLAPPFAEVVYP